MVKLPEHFPDARLFLVLIATSRAVLGGTQALRDKVTDPRSFGYQEGRSPALPSGGPKLCS